MAKISCFFVFAKFSLLASTQAAIMSHLMCYTSPFLQRCEQLCQGDAQRKISFTAVVPGTVDYKNAQVKLR